MSEVLDVDELPIVTNDLVLGARISVWQQATLRHRYPGHVTRESAVSCESYGSDRPYCVRNRRYLSAWARRVLFEGAQPRRAES